MRRVMIGVAAAACLAGIALAQDADTAGSGSTPGSSNAALNPKGNAASSVNASGTVAVVSSDALEKGANSFTEGQARSRIEGAGFTGVSPLRKDAGGIWRGRGTRDGKVVDLGFDYKGNIAAQ